MPQNKVCLWIGGRQSAQVESSFQPVWRGHIHSRKGRGLFRDRRAVFMGTVQEQVHSRLPRRPDHRLRGIFLYAQKTGRPCHKLKVSFAPSVTDGSRGLSDRFALVEVNAPVGLFGLCRLIRLCAQVELNYPFCQYATSKCTIYPDCDSSNVLAFFGTFPINADGFTHS